MKTRSTWHIHLRGQVQGVGFRPFVYHIARKMGLKGWVKNAADGVHIEFNADDVVSKKFYDKVISKAPRLSYITSHSIQEITTIDYKEFKIVPSNNKGTPLLLISPDFAMCEDCSKEIWDETNRRYNYAFTTCTQCGPRYSIIKQQPYDREHTSMEVFKMCSRCNEEYNDPANRRHFSQTNSCPNCAVVMQLYDGDKKMVEDGQAGIINRISALWNAGKIVAIKGIGGFLLTCDAANIKAVQELRKRKHRPTKPFALMFPDIQLLQNEVEIDQHEKEELQSAAAPIVLLQLKENVQTELALKDIAPKLNKIGVMRPYAPLFQLLLQQFSRPIVATSGNVSSASIVSDDEVALTELNSIADYILINNREIISPQDDSVISYSPNSQQRLVFRRARGFAPIYKNDIRKLSQRTILALGASLKSSFTLLHQQNIHISQYLGDTDNYNVQKNFETTLKHFLHLFNTQPQVILIDKHPGYFTSFLGRQLAKQWDAKLIELQHHEAHFASVLGEHNLLDESEPVLGVSWDGTGLGDDGQIWGGEFFIYHQHTFTRTNHFDYFDSFLGDKMAMEPRLSAFSLCNKIEEAESILKTKFTAPEWSNYQKLIAYNKLKTSSVGRMFDAVASLLGLIDKTSYEGEAAMLVEKMALQYFKNKLKIPPAWLENAQGENILSAQYLMKEIVTKIKEGKNKSELAAWFHVQLALSIKTIARQQQCNKICFSGGVFQNGLLVDLVNKLLSDKHELHFNKHLSPNDENISFGQIIWFNTSTNKPE